MGKRVQHLNPREERGRKGCDLVCHLIDLSGVELCKNKRWKVKWSNNTEQNNLTSQSKVSGQSW